MDMSAELPKDLMDTDKENTAQNPCSKSTSSKKIKLPWGDLKGHIGQNAWEIQRSQHPAGADLFQIGARLALATLAQLPTQSKPDYNAALSSSLLSNKYCHCCLFVVSNFCKKSVPAATRGTWTVARVAGDFLQKLETASVGRPGYDVKNK